MIPGGWGWGRNCIVRLVSRQVVSGEVPDPRKWRKGDAATFTAVDIFDLLGVGVSDWYCAAFAASACACDCECLSSHLSLASHVSLQVHRDYRWPGKHRHTLNRKRETQLKTELSPAKKVKSARKQTILARGRNYPLGGGGRAYRTH